MKVQTFLGKLKALDSYQVFTFWDKTFDGACPCFSGTRIVDGHQVHVAGRCWRVSKSAQDLYVWSDTMPKKDLQIIARATKKLLDATEWYNPYTIIYEQF